MVKQLKVWIEASSKWLTLPQCQYEASPEEVVKESVMASGLLTEDYIGERMKLSGTISYIPPADLVSLTNQRRLGGYSLVEFLDTDGVTKTALFKIDPLQATIFGQDSYGNDIWKDVKFSMRAQEVSNV